MLDGTVFNIQKFSVNDGPGIRTTVFLKGCPLNCIWCHNPESKLTQPEIFYDKEKCILCGKCGALCPTGSHIFDSNAHTFNRKTCTACGKCADICVATALDIAGKTYTVEQVLKEVLKDKMFYDNSGGGITLSGGEPMLQFDFSSELLKASKNAGLHTCMETCGFSKSENYQKIAQFTDIFLFDYKETNPAKHKEFTGVTNELILKNLFMLDSMGCKTILRCPIVPSLNDRQDHFEGIAKVANSLKNVIEINIEPYHPLGQSKAMRLDKGYPLGDLDFPEKETVKAWEHIIAEKTNVPVKQA